MASSSVSFRISRSAEDLAGTLHLLSQRLVLLEQRLEALEGERHEVEEEDPELVESLGNAERLLLDCRALLGGALDDAAHPSAAISPAGSEAVDTAVVARERDWTDVGSIDSHDRFDPDGFEAEADLDGEADAAIESGDPVGAEERIDSLAA